MARYKREGQTKGRPLGGGAKSGVLPGGVARREGRRDRGAGPRPRVGRTARVPVYCWTPEKAGWRVSATVGL